jgi:hypothetical protein
MNQSLVEIKWYMISLLEHMNNAAVVDKRNENHLWHIGMRLTDSIEIKGRLG